MSLTDKVAKAIYDSYKYVRPWGHPKTQEVHGRHTREAARAAIKAIRSTPQPR